MIIDSLKMAEVFNWIENNVDTIESVFNIKIRGLQRNLTKLNHVLRA